jgi:hypothetical protein
MCKFVVAVMVVDATTVVKSDHKTASGAVTVALATNVVVLEAKDVTLLDAVRRELSATKRVSALNENSEPPLFMLAAPTTLTMRALTGGETAFHPLMITVHMESLAGKSAAIIAARAVVSRLLNPASTSV